MQSLSELLIIVINLDFSLWSKIVTKQQHSHPKLELLQTNGALLNEIMVLPLPLKDILSSMIVFNDRYHNKH